MDVFTSDTIDPSLFIGDVDPDWICSLCTRVPRKMYNVRCCGKIGCYDCISRHLKGSTKCPWCNIPGLELTNEKCPSSPFFDRKVAGMTVHCPYYKCPSEENKTSSGCQAIMLFGTWGVRVDEHLKICPFAMIPCPDCLQVIRRSDILIHHGTGKKCQYASMTCTPCQVTMMYRDYPTHIKTSEHLYAVTDASLQAIDCITAMKAEIATLKLEERKIKDAMVMLTREMDEKVVSCNTRIDQRINDVLRYTSARICKFKVCKWSEIKETTLFSTSSPLKKWNHSWWLKVEKPLDNTRIGVYLCCDELGPLPVSVDYQMMVRHRGKDSVICPSVVFRTEFGKDKAWGLSKFVTLEQLIKEGGYIAEEDIIEFACIIYPIANLVWGPAMHRIIHPQ